MSFGDLKFKRRSQVAGNRAAPGRDVRFQNAEAVLQKTDQRGVTRSIGTMRSKKPSFLSNIVEHIEEACLALDFRVGIGTTNELFTGSTTYPASVFTPGPYGLGVRVPSLAGIARAWAMLAGEPVDAAAVVKSFRKSLRCVLMLNSPRWQSRAAA